jgi:hypothetical protein
MFLSDVTSHCQMLLNAKHITESQEQSLPNENYLQKV